MIGSSLLITTMTFASGNTDTKQFTIDIEKSSKACYTQPCISTAELQKEVERLSQEGKLPFEMGLELFKRWSKKA